MIKFEETIDRYIKGELSPQEKEELIEAVESDMVLKEQLELAISLHSAIEMEIMDETKKFLEEREIANPSKTHLSMVKRMVYYSGIAASLLILVIAMVTVNFSHNDGALADTYRMASLNVRSAESDSDIQFNEALQNYYFGNFDEAKANLENILNDGSLIAQDKEWLQLLITLKTQGGNSENFRDQLTKIKNNMHHEYFEKANQLERDLNSFWRNFVFDK